MYPDDPDAVDAVPTRARAHRAGWAVAVMLTVVSLASGPNAHGQAPEPNRPPTPIPSPKGPGDSPEKPPEPDTAPAQPEAEPPAPFEPPVKKDSRPNLAWVQPVGGDGSGGNATVLRDRSSGRAFLVTTIDALGFCSGKRSVEILVMSPRAGGQGKARRDAKLPPVDAYEFRVLPADDDLGELCVLELAPDQEKKLSGAGTLGFTYTDEMKDAWRPQDTQATCCALDRAEGELRWQRIGVPGPSAAAGAAAFAEIPSRGGNGEIRRVLMGVAGRRPGADADMVHRWPNLRRLIESTDRIDDARALSDYVSARDRWGNQAALKSAVDWSRSNGFPRVAHWQVLPMADAELQFPYRPYRLPGGREACGRMLCALSGEAGDNLTLEIGNSEEVGAERHQSPDAAVAVRDARAAKDLKASIRLEGGPGAAPSRKVMVIETAGAAEDGLGALPAAP